MSLIIYFLVIDNFLKECDITDMLVKYQSYLEKLNSDLDTYFSEQQEFIKCKKGCSICCKSSYYPVSELEHEYIKICFKEKLSEGQQEEVRQKTLQIMRDRREFLVNNSNIFDFSYECPFLLDNSCSIYEYRALLCRSHGLIYKDVDKANKLNFPYCVKLGHNYADIWDSEKNTISIEKMKALDMKVNPEIFDLSYSTMMNDAEGVEFGDVRMLFEWIILDIPNYEELIAPKETVV